MSRKTLEHWMRLLSIIHCAYLSRGLSASTVQARSPELTAVVSDSLGEAAADVREDQPALPSLSESGTENAFSEYRSRNSGEWSCRKLWSNDLGEGAAGENDAYHLLLFKEKVSSTSSEDAVFQGPLYEKKTLFLSDQTGNYFALDADHGQWQWTKHRNSERGRLPFSAQLCIGPVAAGKHFFLLSHPGEIFCFKQGFDAPFRWQADLKHTLGNRVVVHRGRVFAQDAQQNLYALNLENGDILWRHALIDTAPLSQTFFGYKATGVPLVLPCGSILALDDQGYLSLVHPVTGEKLERKNLCLIKDSHIGFEEGAIVSLAMPRQDKNFIYIPTLQGIFVLYKDGIGAEVGLNIQEAWQNTEDKIWSDIEFSGVTLYYTTLKGEVVAVNKQTGEEIWRTLLVTSGSQLLGSPKLFTVRGEDGATREILLIVDRSGVIHGCDPATGAVVLKEALVSEREGLYENFELDVSEDPQKSDRVFVTSLYGKVLCFTLEPSETRYFIPHPLDVEYNPELHDFDDD